ncbi:hypothetical protein VVD49_09240 [Uliginosibacterium sp. H3]|uniref:Uncharacterized protein n=1 Tax=Uliginosibacterium silvisoli TaxID=3114758 RepID=A0ABU6K1V1_9RHOO|nr:hypothetical protein [Uliginosibacterium sp. H3]
MLKTGDQILIIGLRQQHAGLTAKDTKMYQGPQDARLQMKKPRRGATGLSVNRAEAD